MNNENIEFKKLKFKARRGMLELDLILKKYLDTNFSDMDASLKQQFEELMDLTDPELWDILVNEYEHIITDTKYSACVAVIRDIISRK